MRFSVVSFIDTFHCTLSDCTSHLTLPSRHSIQPGVLREAMKGVLPEVLYKREKFAFMAPPGHTDRRKRSAMQALCSRHMGEEQIRETGLFDVNRVQAFLEGYFTGTDPVQGARSDILFNHLVGIHLLKEQVVP